MVLNGGRLPSTLKTINKLKEGWRKSTLKNKLIFATPLVVVVVVVVDKVDLIRQKTQPMDNKVPAL